MNRSVLSSVRISLHVVVFRSARAEPVLGLGSSKLSSPA
jgi:hypothetical protein